MARIRTIKPIFFRHEKLQDLEAENPGSYPMLVFAGLWGHCDKLGHFEWRPRQLKLDILPFLDFSMSQTLHLLEQSRFIFKYSVDGKEYGEINSFPEHQRITGKEAQEPARYPEPNSVADETQSGHTRETTETTGMEYRERSIGKGMDPDIVNPKSDSLVQTGGNEELVVPVTVDEKIKGNGKRPKGGPACPYQEIMDIYNATLTPDLPEAQKLTKTRMSHIAARHRDEAEGRLEFWHEFFTAVKSSDLLMGRKPQKNGGLPWRATFDWLINQSNFVKVAEGNYL